MRVDAIDVKITHPERVLFPADNITKADLARYYADMARDMLPHLRGRPLNVQRFPRGLAGAGFVQQAAPDKRPDWVRTVAVDKEDGRVTHVVVENAPTLVWLANLSCITLHTWLSCADDLDRPDRMVLDLDPDGDDFESARRAARSLKAILDSRGWPAWLMTTGSRGLHVLVPIEPRLDSNAVRAVVQQLAEDLAATDPGRITTEIRKEDRGGRLFVDTLRNAYAHTAVAPFSVRALAGAPVAAPIRWEDLDDPSLTSRRYTIRDVDRLMDETRAAWSGMTAARTDLRQAARKAA